jgi:tetratricopeptide (TPR) repeat protein
VDGTPAIRADLDRWFGTHDVRELLLAHYVLGGRQLAALTEQDPSGALNTDLHLLLEFDAPLHLFRKLAPSENANFALLGALDRAWTGELALAMGFSPGSAQERAALGEHAFQLAQSGAEGGAEARARRLTEAAAELEAAVAMRPDLVQPLRVLARVRLAQDRRADAVEAMARVVALAPADALSHAKLAEELLRLRLPGRAVTHFRAALELWGELSAADSSVMWANNLAWILATSPDPSLRNGEEAVLWATRASATAGGENAALLDTLAVALAEAGRFEEALVVARRLEALAGDNEKEREAARARINSFQASQPVRAD